MKVCHRVGRITKKNLTQTITDAVYETMSRNQVKLGRTKKL